MRFCVTLKSAKGEYEWVGVATDEWAARRCALRDYASCPGRVPSWCHKVEVVV